MSVLDEVTIVFTSLICPFFLTIHVRLDDSSSERRLVRWDGVPKEVPCGDELFGHVVEGPSQACFRAL